MSRKRGLSVDAPISILRTAGGIAIGDHVKIDREGWYGHGEVGAVNEIHHGIYVRIPNGQCFRMEEKHLTKVEKLNCRALCCVREPYEDREILSEKIQDL